MNCHPCQTFMLHTGELLRVLNDEALTPEARVLVRGLAASLHVVGVHVVDQQIRKLMYEPSQRDRAKEA